MKSTWKRIWKFLRSVIGWWALGTIVLIVVLNFYTISWTGFGDYTTPTGEYVHQKTLWDWMELLIIPVFLWVGAVAVNRSEKELERKRSEERAKLERELETDRQQEAVLQAYIDRMSELLLKDKLRTARNKEVRNVARTRTLTVVRALDAKRKGIVLVFLWEAGLIHNTKSLVSLTTADLRRADLQHTHLASADLSYIDFFEANLSSADLSVSDLRWSNFTSANLSSASLLTANLEFTKLSGANLISADLSYAVLSYANLSFADLTDADLSGADLTGASLTGAIISGEQLLTAKSLKGTIMPDGTKHD